MKTSIFVTLLFLIALLGRNVASAQTYVSTWQSLDGPWYASRPIDISIGYRGQLKVMYVADSTGNSLLSTTDEGSTWKHLSILNPTAVACLSDPYPIL
jgi:hypothetical protein